MCLMKRALTGLRLSQFLWVITILVLEALIGQGGEATLQERPWFYMAQAAAALHLLALYSNCLRRGEVCGERSGRVDVIEDQKI